MLEYTILSHLKKKKKETQTHGFQVFEGKVLLSSLFSFVKQCLNEFDRIEHLLDVIIIPMLQ